MTRLFTDGAEMGDVKFWDWVNPYGTITAVQVPAPVGGEWSYKGAWLGADKLLTADQTSFYMRYRLRTDNNASAQYASMIAWRHGTTELGKFSIDSLNRFVMCMHSGINDFDYGQSGIVMNNNVWYLIEIHVSISPLAGVFEALIDGVQYIAYAGQTQPGVDTHIDNIYWASSAYPNIYLDDLAMNDINGLVDNSWCGDGIITKMYPNGNGSHNNWTGSDGDSVNNYLQVDDFPNDGDATYVYQDGTSSGVQDQYALNDLDYTNKSVLRIYPEARARKTSADGSAIKLGIKPSGGADDMSASRNLFVDDYYRIIGNEYLTNPVTALPWVEADLDSLEGIIEVA